MAKSQCPFQPSAKNQSNSRHSDQRDAWFHGRDMAEADYRDGRKSGFTASPWTDAKRKAAYDLGYKTSYDRLIADYGQPKLVDHRGDALWD